jgi:PKD repeat protein
MPKHILRLTISLFLLWLCTGTTSIAAPVKIILETDLEDDCDDMGALAMIHALIDYGECELLAVMVNGRNVAAAECVDAVNTYYNRPDIPIGRRDFTPSSVTGYGYAYDIAQDWPHDLESYTDCPTASELYRQILSEQADESVTIVSIGWLGNLKDLLDSEADAYSDLDGEALVAQKVKELSLMGGGYPTGREYNFVRVPEATYQVVYDWPTPIMYSGWELGAYVQTGARLIETPEDNPVRYAYKYKQGAGNDRESWDQTSVLYAVRGLQDYWSANTTGRNTFDATTYYNYWLTDQDPDGRAEQGYLKALMDPDDVSDIIDELMLKTPGAGEPIADFTATITNMTVNLDASDSYGGSGSITAYGWDFGDGDSASGVSASHIYDVQATYEITLTVSNDAGQTDTFTQSLQVPAPTLAEELVAHWAFDASSGNTAYDSSDNHLSATLSNASWVEGRDGNALSFDGSAAVQAPSDDALALSSFTLMTWVKIPNEIPSGWKTILEHNRSGENWYGLWKSASSDCFHFRWGPGTANFSQTIVADTWYHIAVSFDAETGIAVMYLNGAVDSTSSSSTAPAPTTDSFTIGMNKSGSEGFIGLIDDVRVYQSALSQSEVALIYQTAGQRTSRGTPYSWLDSHGLNWTGDYETSDELDADGDGMPAWEEYTTGTNPQTESTPLQMLDFQHQNSNDEIQLKWSSIPGKTYQLWYSTDLSEGFSEIDEKVTADAFETQSTFPTGNDTQGFYKITVE